MKVYTKIVYDKDDNIIEQHSYNYSGPVAQARFKSGKGPGETINEKKGIYHTGTSVEKQIENLKNNLGVGRQRKINEQTLRRLEKEREAQLEGEVNNYATTDEGYTSNNNDGIGPGLLPNVLHKFASYNTLFTLSGVNEQELKDRSFLQNPVHDVIARSSGIGGDPNLSGTGLNDLTIAGPQIDIKARENKSYKFSVGVLEKGRDIFFEDVNMLSTVGPSEERGLADFVKMEFKLHEPYGISFIEKVRAAARINGYRDYQDAPLLLTIEFKGFDENGIPMSAFGTVRKIPILITRVELDVNEGGAIYDVTAVRIQDIAFDDRFKFPRSEITINASTLEGAGQQLADQLNKQILKEQEEHKVREVLDEYKIEFDEKVLELASGYIGGRDIRNTYVGPRAPNKGRKKIEIEVTESQVSSLISITKVLEDMVRSTVGYEDLASDFWTSYLRRTGQIRGRGDASEEDIKKFVLGNEFEETIKNNSFVDWFKIKTSVETDYNQFDNINKMHRKIITYKVVPYKIHVLKFMRPGVFVSKGVAKNDVKKQYNYLYTGDNTDIQNLRINYKTAYYMRNTIEISKGADGVFEKLDNIITKLIGGEDPEGKDLSGLRSAPSIVKGRNTFNKADTDKGKLARSQDFYDYLTNPTVDMMRIEMEILGDPAFICQDQYVPVSGKAASKKKSDIFDGNSGSFNADSYTPLMELVYRLPDDVDDNAGVMFQQEKSTVPENNLFFSGVYQIVKIESKFTNGQFLQTLTCVRLNNQGGDGEPLFEIQSQAASKLTDAFDKAKLSKQKVEDSIKENRKKKIKQNINNIVDYFR